MSKISKKRLFYYWLLAEEGIAYYLTFKWQLILLACVISFFPTVMVWWSIDVLLEFRADWSLIFFLTWIIIMIIFVLEFPLPDTLKDKVKEKFSDIL